MNIPNLQKTRDLMAAHPELYQAGPMDPRVRSARVRPRASRSRRAATQSS